MDKVTRDALSRLHTWAGVLIGSLLFAIFWMGTLSVFDREIDRWMMPDTRLSLPPEPASLDETVLPVLERLAPGAPRWQIMLPTPRAPIFTLKFDRAGETITREIDPITGRLIPDQATLGGTGFIFPFHYGLHLRWHDVGFWIVGVAAMAMLLQLVSGVLMHRKLFGEFFTFRRTGTLRRGSLDLHTLTGVLVLPFHLLITLSGLIIFVGIYFPQAHIAAYGAGAAAAAAYEDEGSGVFARGKAGEPATLASLDDMLARAREEWSGEDAFMIRIWNPGDANAYVEVRRSTLGEVSMNIDRVYFDGASGDLLRSFEPAPAMKLQRFVAGIHFIRFEHWPLRFLYFLAGLAGCALIGTGFSFWIETRRKRHLKKNLAGVPIVHGLMVGSITGLIVATLAFFIANRMLPLDASLSGVPRSALEVWVFFVAWMAAFAHAGLRPRPAWREQCQAIAALAVTAVVLNALTTGDHLVSSLASGTWSVAGFDLGLLAAAVVAGITARLLKRREHVDALASVSAHHDAPKTQHV